MANNPNNIGSAYSDDGRIKNRIQHEEIINQNHVDRTHHRSDLEGMISLQADMELSVNPNREEGILHRVDQAAISERPDEAEEASSPPGTIGDRDIMSEHITTNMLKYRKGKAYNNAWMDDGVSEEAHKSTITKISKVAEVSATITLNETTRALQSFSLMYDRIQ